MLRSDLPFEPRNWLWKGLFFFLGEAFLGFLAISAAALTLIPMLFTIADRVNGVLEAGQWTIIAIFALEYGLGLVWAPNRRAFLLNPWRLLDLLTIVLPLATLLPQVSSVLRSSPVLRLIRLVRIVTLGVRAGTSVMREAKSQSAADAVTGPVAVSLLRGAEPPSARTASWDEFLAWVKAPGEAWCHVSNFSQDQLKEMAAAAGIPPAYLQNHLFGATYPHIEVMDRYAALFLWLPHRPEEPSADRHGLLLLLTDRAMFTLSRHAPNLQEPVVAALPRLGLPALPFPARMTCAFLRTILDRQEELVGHFERDLRAAEEVPVHESRPEFFARTFRLKKELSAAQSDLWRLKGMLNALAEGRFRLPGVEKELDGFFRALANDSDYLYETVVNLREGLLSVIDLHLNVVSFEMNRVMRVLAVVSVLGLIPAVVGGLLGMNLSDNPWPLTLPQVTFGVGLGMVLCLYLFFVKGWLR